MNAIQYNENSLADLVSHFAIRAISRFFLVKFYVKFPRLSIKLTYKISLIITGICLSICPFYNKAKASFCFPFFIFFSLTAVYSQNTQETFKTLKMTNNQFDFYFSYSENKFQPLRTQLQSNFGKKPL
jgi:hypothetical protein